LKTARGARFRALRAAREANEEYLKQLIGRNFMQHARPDRRFFIVATIVVVGVWVSCGLAVGHMIWAG
jgi:hypothetical protein